MTDDPRPSLLDGVRSGAWLDEQVFPELRYTVPLIIPEGTTVLAGPPKVGKSWAVLHIALSVSDGGEVFGCLPIGKSRPVLYLALEDGHRRLQARARSLLGLRKKIPAALDVIIAVQQGLVVATIAEWLERHGPNAPLVIVDTLGRIMPGSRPGESAYERDYRAVAQFKKLTDDYPGASLILVHHTRKLASDDFVDGVSGTLGITGAADTTVVLSRSRSDDAGLLKVTGRDVHEGEYKVEKAENGLWRLVGDSADAAQRAAATDRVSVGVSDRSSEIIGIVAAAGAAGIGPSKVAEKIRIEAKDAGQYLRRLVKSGRIRQIGRGQYVALDSTHSTDTTQGAGGDDDRALGAPDSPVERVEGVEFQGEWLEATA